MEWGCRRLGGASTSNKRWHLVSTDHNHITHTHGRDAITFVNASTPSLLITLITYLGRGRDVTPLVEQRLQALHMAVQCRPVQGCQPILKDDNGYRYEERGEAGVEINGYEVVGA